MVVKVFPSSLDWAGSHCSGYGWLLTVIVNLYPFLRGVVLYVGSMEVVVTPLAFAVVACLWCVGLLDQLSVV